MVVSAAKTTWVRWPDFGLCLIERVLRGPGRSTPQEGSPCWDDIGLMPTAWRLVGQAGGVLHANHGARVRHASVGGLSPAIDAVFTLTLN
jgi:hypothetical protein